MMIYNPLIIAIFYKKNERMNNKQWVKFSVWGQNVGVLFSFIKKENKT